MLAPQASRIRLGECLAKVKWTYNLAMATNNLGRTIRSAEAALRVAKKPPQSEGGRWYESWLSDSPV
jgi:hypothetical protein